MDREERKGDRYAPVSSAVYPLYVPRMSDKDGLPMLTDLRRRNTKPSKPLTQRTLGQAVERNTFKHVATRSFPKFPFPTKPIPDPKKPHVHPHGWNKRMKDWELYNKELDELKEGMEQSQREYEGRRDREARSKSEPREESGGVPSQKRPREDDDGGSGSGKKWGKAEKSE